MKFFTFQKKYDIGYNETLEFLDNVVIPFVEILEIYAKLYSLFKMYIVDYNLKPSDAMYAAHIKAYKLDDIKRL